MKTFLKILGGIGIVFVFMVVGGIIGAQLSAYSGELVCFGVRGYECGGNIGGLIGIVIGLIINYVFFRRRNPVHKN